MSRQSTGTRHSTVLTLVERFRQENYVDVAEHF